MQTRLLEAPPPGWGELLRADTNASPAHRPEVAFAFAHVLPGTQALWLVAEDEQGLAGGFPLCLERRAGASWLHALPFLLPGAPLVRAGAVGVEWEVATAFAELARDRGVAGGEWAWYRPVGAAGDEVLGSVPGRTTHFDTAVISIDSRSWASRLDRDDRHKLRRSLRSGFEFAEDTTALEEVYSLHRTQSRGWPGHRPLPLELSRRLLAPGDGGGEPAARLLVLRDERRIVTGIFVLDHDRECFLWWSGARREGRATSATRALMVATAEWAALRGRERLNLGGSAGIGSLAAFKRSLGARDVSVSVRWLDATHASWPARGLAAIQRTLRRRRQGGAPP